MPATETPYATLALQDVVRRRRTDLTNSRDTDEARFALLRVYVHTGTDCASAKSARAQTQDAAVLEQAELQLAEDALEEARAKGTVPAEKLFDELGLS